MKNIFSYLSKRSLTIVVFITGACVLVLEVVATRILSPYFGNTIFNYSSVIGIVLAALSIGYYAGGKYADKHPSQGDFYRIIIFSGYATVIIKLLMWALLPFLGASLSITTGPVISSLLLFSLPCLLLGMLSPYAIKLQEIKFKKSGIGTLSGEIFFYSTLGSIFGSFLAGFYLIPTFGIGNIVLGVGLVLFIMGMIGSFYSRSNKKVFLIVISFSFLTALSSVKENLNSNLIFVKEGHYERIGVLDTEFEGKKVRLLVQERSFSSGIDKGEPDRLLFDYTKYIDLYKLTNNDPKKALFIGGGAYSMPSYLIRTVPRIKVDVAEVEAELFPIAKKYFFVRDDPRLFNHIEDGRRFLRDTNNRYDIIFSDVYSSVYSIPSHFTTKEFFLLGRSKLNNNGVFLVNIISDLSKKKPSLLFSEIRTFREVFPNSLYFAVDSPEKSGNQNIILMGLMSDQELDLNNISFEYGNDPVLKNLSQKVFYVNNSDLIEYPLMTDDYSPAEYLTSKLFL